jgi:hypothetical protein
LPHGGPFATLLPVATAELQSSLAKFVTFTRALGHGGVQEAGATLEFRIA